MSEIELLSWLRERVPGLTDDVTELPTGSWVVTTDHQVPGVHVPEGTAAEVVAERLLRVNLSDIAAGGARPRFVFANVAAPADYPVKGFMDGLVRACREFDVELRGGDTSSAPRPVFSLTLFGDLPEGGRSPARSRAEPGDRLWLSGSVGQSRVGREALKVGIERIPTGLRAAAEAAVERHLRPEPHLEVGQWLAAQARTAAIDISDGLALDLHRLCEASGVGAILEANALPLAGDHAALAEALELDPLEAALGGGEDYVLLFSLPEEIEPPAALGAVEVGVVTAPAQTAPGAVRLREDGKLSRMATMGWNHLTA